MRLPLSLRFTRKYNVAIVGTGPAGFYTAHHLLQKSASPLRIDFFDRLPAPYGLSRYGVAPDHPEVKKCEEYLDRIMDEHSENVRFFGNVNVGQDVSLAQLEKHYHSVVLAYGCTAADKSLSIEGSSLPGVVPARKIVNWYNGHPDSVSAEIPPWEKIENVTIIGNGNVAIDVARVLLAGPRHWAPTDMLARAVEQLERSAVKKVNIVARRGLLHSAFTNKEMRELLQLPELHFLPIADSVMEPIRPLVKTLGRVDKRKFTMLEKACGAPPPPEAKNSWALEFFQSPRQFVAAQDPQLLSETVFEENEQDGAGVRATGRLRRLKNDLAVLSIGYSGRGLPGFEECGLVFDEKKNCALHIGGRMLSPQGEIVPGWYAAGWLRSGPRGVIASTMMEAFDTAEKVLLDLDLRGMSEDKEDIKPLLPEVVEWDGWTRVDKYELEEGARLGKSRSKVESAEEMVRLARS